MTNLRQLSLLTLLIAATPALAAPAEPVSERIVVRIADLDLDKDSDRRRLDHRLARAAVEACGTASNADLAGRNEVRRCVQETRAFLAGERDRRLATAPDPAVRLAIR